MNKAALARKLVIGLACLLIALTPEYSFAIDPASPPAAQAPAPEAKAPQVSKISEEELEKLLAPIALYPDALLAQLLPASAYPLDIVHAERWLEKNKAAVAKQDFSGGDAQDWDPSVKALLRFPAVVKKLSEDLAWTTSLGDAIVNQPQDVANGIQLLRAKAQEAGTLKTTMEQMVTTQKQDGRDVVIIESPDPSVVYVPLYDPVAVYNPPPEYVTGGVVAAGLLTFGAAIAIGSAWRGSYWNWGTGAFYPPIWPGYPGWRPPYAGWRPGMPIGGGGNIGNGISDRPWRPDGGRYRPGGRPPSLGGGVGGRPGLGGGVGGRPGLGGGVGGPPGLGGGANRPNARPRPATRPAARSAARPGTHRPAARPGARPRSRPATRPARHRPANLGVRGGGGHRAFRPGGHGGFHGHRGGFHGHRGGFHGGRGGFRGGGRGRRSDFRLKHNITLLGHLNNGLGFYSFVYNGGERTYVGVIAQEVQTVMPDAVSRGPDGYLRVFYEKLGLKFQTYDQWIASGARILP
jgi:hypothetical protein